MNTGRTRVILILVACLLGAPHALGGQQPNFIFFITDDISWNDLGCYGNTAVKTPHLDRLATEGLVFDNAYLTISSCSPSRCSIVTGRYPHNTGAPELHTSLPDGQYMFPNALREAGYWTVLSGKNHMGNAVRQAFNKISSGTGPGKEGDWVSLLRDRPRDRPFFFWFASTDAHRGWQINNQAPTYDPASVPVPCYLFDGPRTRKDLADYYHEVSRTDHFAGKLRDELERQGVAKTTYFFYCSDNGRPFPRCKTRLYDSGIKTPLIVRCPGKVKQGRSVSLVSAIDFGPTMLELAGVKQDPRVQGVSFAPLLRNPALTTRDYVFAEHNWHVFQAHERMVRSGPWVYIRNAWPQRQNLCVESAPQFPAGAELWQQQEKGILKPAQQDIFQKPRPSEELYNIIEDPHQLRNCAASETRRTTLLELRRVLDRWTTETGDSVPKNPTGDRQNAYGKRYAGFKRGVFPGADRNASAVTQPGPIRKASP